MANVLEDWYPPKKCSCCLVSRHIWFTIDLIPGCEVILVLRAAIGGVANIILVVRAPIGGVPYFRFYPFADSRKILLQPDWLTNK